MSKKYGWWLRISYKFFSSFAFYCFGILLVHAVNGLGYLIVLIILDFPKAILNKQKFGWLLKFLTRELPLKQNAFNKSSGSTIKCSP